MEKTKPEIVMRYMLQQLDDRGLVVGA